MGVYRAAIVTENGQNLIAQALANEKPLIFTSAKTSSYSYPVGTDVPALTGLQDVVQSVLPFDSKVLGGNVAQVSVRFDNDGVDQTYRIETIGLYAKIEGGAETLFSVTQATTPDEMPVQSDISPSAYIYNIQHTVQNASQITLTVNPAGTATVQDIMDIESPEFDDSGTVEGISSFPSFLETMKSKMNFFQFFRNLKAGLQFVLHAGQIVNNCVTDNAGLPLSAAQGKALMDKYTQLYSDLNTTNNNLSNTNSRLDTSLSSSVLDYALTLPEGMHTVRFPGDGYTGADTPNSYYRYSSATIIVRSKGKIVTVLLYGISTKAPLAVNSYDGGKWNGWDQYVTKDDLATKLELVATDFLPLTAATIQPNNYTFFIFNPSLPSGYILVGACLKDTNALARKVVPVYCNASSSNGTHRINLQLANTSNDVVSITADMAIAFYLFVRKK